MSFGKSLVVRDKDGNDDKKPGDAGKALARVAGGTSVTSMPQQASTVVAKKMEQSLELKKNGATIVFVIDATASREANWVASQTAQAKMFNKAAGMGDMHLSILCHRGDKVEYLGTFSNGTEAGARMKDVSCLSGHTRLGEALARSMSLEKTPSAIIMVGDSCQDCQADSHRRLFDMATEMLRKGIKVYAVHDPHSDDDPRHGAEIYKKVAEMTGGSFVTIDDGKDFANLCEAIVALEVGGAKKFQELVAQGNQAAKKLIAGSRTPLLGGPRGK